jgi:hypothetical protein
MIVKKIIKISILIFGLLPFISWVYLYATVGLGVHVKDPLSLTLGYTTFASIPILLIFYISNIFRNSTVAKNDRAIWIVFMVLASSVIFPFYWYFHIWKDVEKPLAAQKENEIISTKRPVSKPRNYNTLFKKSLLVIYLLALISEILVVLILLNVGQNIWFRFFEISSLLLFFALMIFFIVDILRNAGLKNDQRTLWVVLVIIAHTISIPLYWYLHIWHQPEVKKMPSDLQNP